jgi:hypothetical protein
MHYSINPAGPVGQSLEKSHKDHLKVFISHGIQLVRPPFTKTRSVGANNSNVTMVYGTYNYRIHGVYKPTFTSLGGPQCTQSV